MDPSAPERLAFFLPSLAGGGVARMTLNLVEEGLRRKHEVDLVLAREAGPLRAEVPPGARVVTLRRGWQPHARALALAAGPSRWRELLRPVLLPLRGAHAVAALPDLVAYLRLERPALLVAAKTHTNLTAIWARALAGTATRVVVSERTSLSHETRGPKGRKWRWRYVAPLLHAVYPDADLVYAVSRGAADDLAEQTGLPRERIQTIYNPVVTDSLRERTSEPCGHPWYREGEPPVLLGAGRLDLQKDFPTLIRAFARVRARRPARLMILGEGRERAALERLADSLGVSEDVALPGFVPNPSAYMADAAVFVFCSIYEGLGNALIEAMQAGCPVVSTDCPSGPSEILEGGRFGPLVPVGDDAALAEAILRRLEAPRDADRLRARAQDFTVEVTLDRILQASSSLCPPPPARSHEGNGRSL
ncbi:MAG: glycosyltransferase [Myxococcota bacterium]|nr:glycosyltransferase [Myxococcota bacterium]